MPEVDEPDDIGAVFATARRAASGEGEQPPVSPGRHVIIVTPGRMLKYQPCPPAGSMAAPKVARVHRPRGLGVRRTSVGAGGRLPRS